MRTGCVRRCGNVTRRESTRQSQKNCKNKHSRIPCVQNWADNDTHSRQQRWAENDAHQQEHARERDTGNVPGTSRHQSFVAQEENVLRPWTRLKANTVHNSIKYPKTTFELCMKVKLTFASASTTLQSIVKLSAFITKQVTFSCSFVTHQVSRMLA